MKGKKTATDFDRYLTALSPADMGALAVLFSDLDARCSFAKEEKKKLRGDYENALLYYAKSGLPLAEALARLDVKNLGGFYSRPPILWYPLDDAAKIYPLSMKHGQMAIFRLSVYLNEQIKPQLLQMALNYTIKRFPSLATTVKKGFFWHYLDTAKRCYRIEPDSGLPCRPMKISSSGSQSFRVMYYDNRVSVEFFHILTDGTGGMTFLKTLIAEYFRLDGIMSTYTESVLDVNEAPKPGETANEFDRAEKTEKNSGFMDKTAVQMSGGLTKTKPYRVLHFQMNAAALKAAATSRNATVTAYVLALMFLAGRYATDEQKGEMNIQIPVNMRKFYPSDTVRNFAMYCGIRLPVDRITEKNDILPEISRQLTEKASKQAMSEMMNSTESMVKAVRFVPLFIKAPVARVVYGFLGDKIFTNTLSNLGVVHMPPELESHIKSFDFVLGTAMTNRASCSMVTFGETATLSIAKMTADPSFEEKLYQLFTQDGVEIRVEGSAGYEG